MEVFPAASFISFLHLGHLFDYCIFTDKISEGKNQLLLVVELICINCTFQVPSFAWK